MKTRKLMFVCAAGFLAGCGGTINLESPTAPAPVLKQVIVQPASATVPAGSTQPYCARGIYSDSPDPREITSSAVTWSSLDPSVATVPSPPNNVGSCITATAVAAGSTAIQASTVNSEGSTLTSAGQITVPDSGPTVLQLLRVEPATATVAVGNTQQFVACGRFSDDSTASSGPCSTAPAGRPVSNGQVTWSSGNLVAAPIDANGVATGIAAGTAVVTATLNNGVGAANGQRSATASLTVVVAPCVKPLLESDGATVTTAKGSLCLACQVENPTALINDDPTTSLDSTHIIASVAVADVLGLGFISLTVQAAPGVTFAPGPPAGFLIGRPIGDLLTAEVMSQTTVSTLLDGVVQESTSDAGDPLRLELLGMRLVGIGSEVLAIEKTTKSFDSVRLTFEPSIASVLSKLDVFGACSAVNLTAPFAPSPP